MTATIPKHNFQADEMVRLGRTSQTNIDTIKTWLTYIPAIPPLSNEQIVIFLIACNNDIDATKNCIVCYFKYKSAAPELFFNRDVDNEELVFTHKVTKFAVIPERTKDNYAIAMASLRDTSYSNYHLDSQVKSVYMLLDLVLYENPPAGLVVVINLKGVGIMHVTRLKLSTVKKFFLFLQEALPTQLKQIHILNTSYVFDKIIMILKPFMNKDLFDMIITHPPNMNMNEFYEKYIPADLLPSDFGGNLPNLDQLSEETKLECRKLRHFFEIEQEQIDIYKQNST